MSAREPWADVLVPRVRPAGPEDRDRVAGLLARMDRDGLYERHFAHGEAPNHALLRRLDAVDGSTRVAVLAVGADGTAVGHAEYVATDAGAEFALMVEPGWRDRGVGRVLLGALVDQARQAGLKELNGIVQATNTRAIQLVRRMGFDLRPGEDRRTVIVWRTLRGAGLPATSRPAAGPGAASPELPSHDPDRIPLHRRPGP